MTGKKLRVHKAASDRMKLQVNLYVGSIHIQCTLCRLDVCNSLWIKVHFTQTTPEFYSVDINQNNRRVFLLSIGVLSSVDFTRIKEYSIIIACVSLGKTK